jgi:hypothetical protein
LGWSISLACEGVNIGTQETEGSQVNPTQQQPAKPDFNRLLGCDFESHRPSREAGGDKQFLSFPTDLATALDVARGHAWINQLLRASGVFAVGALVEFRWG